MSITALTDFTGLQPPTIDSFDGAGQADDTGRKLTTFVPANGMTLAQQQVIYTRG